MKTHGLSLNFLLNILAYRQQNGPLSSNYRFVGTFSPQIANVATFLPQSNSKHLRISGSCLSQQHPLLCTNHSDTTLCSANHRYSFVSTNHRDTPLVSNNHNNTLLLSFNHRENPHLRTTLYALLFPSL